jgi:hypothetical protein
MENNYEQRREVHSNLKVLCILSYVWIGIALIMTVIGMVAMMAMGSDTVEQLAEQMNNTNPGSGDAYMETAKNAVPQQLSGIALLVVSLIGVIMMHKLNRKGLIIYSIGELAGYVTMFLFGGAAASMGPLKSIIGETSGNAIMYGGIAVMLILDLLFIFLYKNGLDKSNA